VSLTPKTKPANDTTEGEALECASLLPPWLRWELAPGAERREATTIALAAGIPG